MASSGLEDFDFFEATTEAVIIHIREYIMKIKCVPNIPSL